MRMSNSNKEAEDLYNNLKKSFAEEFFMMVPGMTGDWEKDKKEFVVFYNMNKDILTNG